jgi:hypothetical protein
MLLIWIKICVHRWLFITMLAKIFEIFIPAGTKAGLDGWLVKVAVGIICSFIV